MNVKTIIVLFLSYAISLSNLWSKAIELSSIQQEQFKGASTDCAYFAAINAKTLLEHSHEPIERLQELLMNEGLFTETYFPLTKTFSQTYLYADQLENVLTTSRFFQNCVNFIEVVDGAIFEASVDSGSLLNRLLLAEQYSTTYTKLRNALRDRTLPFLIIIAMNGQHWKASLHYIVLFVREYQGNIQVIKVDSISASYEIFKLQKILEENGTKMEETVRITLLSDIEETNRKAKLECEYIDNASLLLEQAFTPNLVSNGNFETWTSGATLPPDGWFISHGAVERNTEQIKEGTCSVKVNATALQFSIPNPEFFRDKTLSFDCWVYATANDRVNTSYIEIDDCGHKRTQSTHHTGIAGWEHLHVEQVITAEATDVRVYLYVRGAVPAYFSGARCCVD